MAYIYVLYILLSIQEAKEGSFIAGLAKTVLIQGEKHRKNRETALFKV